MSRLLGTYAVEAGELVFRPRFPLNPGMHVRAVYRGVETGVRRPSRRGALRCHDARPRLPVHRCPARERTQALHLLLRRPCARAIPGSTSTCCARMAPSTLSRTRPGTLGPRSAALHRALRPRAASSAASPRWPKPVHPSKRATTYTLVVHRTWRDGRGAPLAEDFRKTFQVTASETGLLRIPGPGVRGRRHTCASLPRRSR